ncbi:hypothetical protein VJY32_07905 [Ignavibacteria bacterium 4148-Me]|uniref:coiled-coil domain-containing protein n=1 Tax=Rosettibacter primus TaxID=3111523 RepID=UPI00336C1C9B
MRTKFLLNSILFLTIFSIAYAQSDYEKTQTFKKQYKIYEDAIKGASSLEECNLIAENIAKFKNDFLADKELLDKVLYPENFESAFAKLERALEVRKSDFTQITELKTEIGTLKSQVTELSEKNEDLLAQINALNLQVKKDAATIASLQKLVAQLKANIQQRDLLVRDIIDSLLTEFLKTPGTLNEAEKQAIITKVDSRNLFYNIERTIVDNIQFMRVTQLTPQDLGEMKKQYRDFNKLWKQIGPKLSDVYLTKQDKASQIANIDGMFFEWNSRLNEEIWTQINQLFREKKLALLPFRSGEQFVNSVYSFIDDEIKNLGIKSKDESLNTYYAFTDSVYFKTVQPVWIPILIENNMMTEADKDSIEAHIAMWKEKVSPPSKFNWVYVAGGIIIIALIVALFMKGRNKQKVVIEEKKTEEL